MICEQELVWLIQKNQDDLRAVREIEEILDELNVRWIEVDIDFNSNELPAHIQERHENELLICHGPSFIPRIDHSDPIWRIGSIFNPVRFRWSEFQKNWRNMMLSADGHISSVSDIQANPPSDRRFIRPDADSKTFEGSVKTPTELAALLKGLDQNLPIVLASPIEIEAEYRIFMVASQVVAASQYRANGKPSIRGFVPNEVVDFAIKADLMWRPADAYVVDIGQSSGRIGIIEANCITAARYYDANARAIVEALCEHYRHD